MSKEMPYEIRQKLFKLKCLGRRGGSISYEDQKFILKCHKDYPEECKKVSEEAFKATAPFGSRV